MARRLADLSASGAGAVNLGMNDYEEERRRRMRRADRDMDAAFNELVMAVYRETQTRLLEQFDTDQRASRLAVSEIDKRLVQLAREQAEAIERAVKLDDGRAIFLSEDGQSIYTEDGERLSDEVAAELLEGRGEELRAGPSWEGFAAFSREREELLKERAEIIEWEQRREELRARVEGGELSQDELEALEREYEESVPDRVQAQRDAATEAATLSVEELVTVSTDAPATPLAARFASMANPLPEAAAIVLPDLDTVSPAVSNAPSPR